VPGTIVLALSGAGLLQDPGAPAELARLRDRLGELEPYEALHPQECPAGQHLPWFAAADGPLPCPWCRIAVLDASAAAGAAACGTSGCGSLDDYVDTSTRRAAQWIEIRFNDRRGMGRWYCTAACAARALAGRDDDRSLPAGTEAALHIADAAAGDPHSFAAAARRFTVQTPAGAGGAR